MCKFHRTLFSDSCYHFRRKKSVENLQRKMSTAFSILLVHRCCKKYFITSEAFLSHLLNPDSRQREISSLQIIRILQSSTNFHYCNIERSLVEFQGIEFYSLKDYRVQAFRVDGFIFQEVDCTNGLIVQPAVKKIPFIF